MGCALGLCLALLGCLLSALSANRVAGQLETTASEQREDRVWKRGLVLEPRPFF